MTGELKGQMIAVLATDGVEQVELTDPVKALKEAGAQVKIVSNKNDQIQGFNHHDEGVKISVDESLNEAEPDDFDGLVLPGGSSPMLYGWCPRRSNSSAILLNRRNQSRPFAMGRGL